MPVEVERELNFASLVEVKGSEQLDGDADLPDPGEGTRSVPRRLIGGHGATVAGLLDSTDLEEIIVSMDMA